MNKGGIEQRSEVRYQVDGTINGIFKLAPDNNDVTFEVLNVSKSGMCVLTDEKLPDQQELLITISDITANVTVAWMIPVGSGTRKYKYGIQSLTPDIDLVDALQTRGMLPVYTMRTTQSESEAFLDEFYRASGPSKEKSA